MDSKLSLLPSQKEGNGSRIVSSELHALMDQLSEKDQNELFFNFEENRSEDNFACKSTEVKSAHSKFNAQKVPLTKSFSFSGYGDQSTDFGSFDMNFDSDTLMSSTSTNNNNNSSSMQYLTSTPVARPRASTKLAKHKSISFPIDQNDLFNESDFSFGEIYLDDQSPNVMILSSDFEENNVTKTPDSGFCTPSQDSESSTSAHKTSHQHSPNIFLRMPSDTDKTELAQPAQTIVQNNSAVIQEHEGKMTRISSNILYLFFQHL